MDAHVAGLAAAFVAKLGRIEYDVPIVLRLVSEPIRDSFTHIIAIFLVFEIVFILGKLLESSRGLPKVWTSDFPKLLLNFPLLALDFQLYRWKS